VLLDVLLGAKIDVKKNAALIDSYFIVVIIKTHLHAMKMKNKTFKVCEWGILMYLANVHQFNFRFKKLKILSLGWLSKRG
jgi:hypothetical protein